MRFLAVFDNKNIFFWLISFGLISIVLLLPGSAFDLSVLVPIIACSVLPKFRLTIVLLYTIVTGLFFKGNFFLVPVYGNHKVDTWSLFASTSTSLNKELLAILAFACYLIVFGTLWGALKKNFKKKIFISTNILVFVILAFIYCCWISLKYNNTLSLVLNLTAVMLSHNAFYIFNYLRFFKNLPNNRQTVFALFQPFWFLTFEIPENPIIEVEKKSDRSSHLKKVAHLAMRILLFKLVLIIVMSLFVSIYTGAWSLTLDENVIFSSTYLPIFKNWRNESALTLLLTLFFSSFTYLFSSFFVFGQTIVAIARMCGFNLPEYIDKPWKSSSFADFFTRVMYYYNIIIINIFLYPTLDFIKGYFKNKKLAMLISLNWALIFGGLFARLLKDINAIYKYGYWGALHRSLYTSLPYLVVLAMAVTASLYFSEKKSLKDPPNRLFRMFFYIFIYGLINPLNFSGIFGGLTEMGKFYMKIVTLGLF